MAPIEKNNNNKIRSREQVSIFSFFPHDCYFECDHSLDIKIYIAILGRLNARVVLRQRYNQKDLKNYYMPGHRIGQRMHYYLRGHEVASHTYVREIVRSRIKNGIKSEVT